MTDPGSVAKTVGIAKAISDAVPIYTDAVQPAAKEVGKALQTVSKTIHVALAPVAALVWGYEKIAAYLSERLEEKLKSTPKERIQTPPANVAGPALEALRFAGQEPALREMYASLLATAMDSDTVHRAHPAFVDIVKQLTPDEAKIMSLLSDGLHRPIVNVLRVWKDASGEVVSSRYQSAIREEVLLSAPDLVPSYLDNLSRLGLVEIVLGTRLAKDELYAPIETSTEVVAICQGIRSDSEYESRFQRTFVALTSLGEQFVAACLA